MHDWLAKYEAGGLENLGDRSHRPRSCPHQMGSDLEVAIARMRTSHPSWGPRRISFELARTLPGPAPSESAVYRALVRLHLIDPTARRGRDRKWKRWERGAPMELWQMDIVGGFVLADGTRAKALTGVDDHSRFCVSAYLVLRETSQRVCEGLALALRTWGVPEQILTDNGKVFTGRFNQPSGHRSMRTEFRTDRVFESLGHAQAELDEWVAEYNTHRPHQALDMATPEARFLGSQSAPVTLLRDRAATARPRPDRADGTWVTRRASAVGVVCVNWQRVCLGVAAADRPVDVWVTEQVLQFYDGDHLLRTEKRTPPGEVRVKRSQAPQRRPRVQTSVTDQPK